MNTDMYNPDAIRSAFKFLVDDFGYSLMRNEETNAGCSIEYAGNDRRVILTHDYRENFFYFSMIQGFNTAYPNDADEENIRSFWHLFTLFDPQLALASLQPDGKTCAEAASLNARLLRQYASDVLTGSRWI